MAIEKIQAIRGMSDMLPEDAPLWHKSDRSHVVL